MSEPDIFSSHQTLPDAHQQLLDLLMGQGYPTPELQSAVIAEVSLEEEEDLVPAEQDVTETLVLQPQKRKSSHL